MTFDKSKSNTCKKEKMKITKRKDFILNKSGLAWALIKSIKTNFQIYHQL